MLEGDMISISKSFIGPFGVKTKILDFRNAEIGIALDRALSASPSLEVFCAFKRIYNTPVP